MSNDWVTEDAEPLYLEKINSSGLTEGDAAELGFSYLTSAQAAAEKIAFLAEDAYVRLPCLVIPYFDPLSGAPLAAQPGWPGFFRARALDVPDPPPKKFGKYTQAPSSGVCAYFPRISPISWPKILADPAFDVLITEGELKAAKACREGYPTIGLGGVHNFKSKTTGEDILPELERINWVQRQAFIVFDSDILTNVNIALSARRLADQLYRRGAIPRLVIVPPAGDGKTGLDDFLMSDGTNGLDYLLRNAEYVTAVRALFEMNDRYAVMTDGDSEVVDMVEGRRVKSKQIVYLTTKDVSSRTIDKTGKVTHEPVNAATVWLTWPLRTEARRFVFDPAEEPLSLTDARDFNVWRGFRVKPREGDVRPFLGLIDHLFIGAPDEHKTWFLDWLACPIKCPGTKMFSAAVLHGLVHGSGKTLVGETMHRIYGEAYTKVGQQELVAPFNEWAASKLFILGDDITGLDRLAMHDTLKVKITQTTVRINPKGLTAYELDDRTNWLFTSNRGNAFYIDRGDRRFFVWEVPASAGKLSRQFYKNYMAWLDEDGPAHLMQWLVSRDLKDFDPQGEPPETAAKNKMREEARSDVSNWVEDLRVVPDELLAIGTAKMDGDLFTNRQLRDAYSHQAGVREDDPRVKNMIGAALSAAGFEQVHGRKPVVVNGKADRYYAIRNAEKWLSASLAEIQEHLSPAKLKKLKF